jgi:hypothetical protein
MFLSLLCLYLCMCWLFLPSFGVMLFMYFQ